jgi:uncharacterized damage-inducible protein DinB
MDKRLELERTDRERIMLLRYLNQQREHILGILEGLDDEQLRKPLLTSGWSCLGLIRHLALDVERFWFSAVTAGDQVAIKSLEGIDNAWLVDISMTTAGLFDLYRQEIERANEIISARDTDSPPAWWPEGLFGDWRVENLHQILLHVITETATHAGHLDVVREMFDGKLWLVL